MKLPTRTSSHAHYFRKIAHLACFVIAGLNVTPIWAQPILIGQTAPFTGGPSGSVREMTLGAKLIIDKENAEGGIRGRQIQLISMDDGFEVPRTVANTRELILDKKVVALFLNRGTPHTQAMAPLLNQYGVPLIAPSTGAMAIHQPVMPNVFNVRSTYQVEAEQLVAQMVSMGVGDRIGIIYVDDSFGQDGLAGALKGFTRAKVKPVFSHGFDRATENVNAAVKLATTLVDGNYPSVIMVGSVNATSTAIRKIREAGSKAYIATLSNNASAGFIRALGPHAEYVIVSQVFPRESAIYVPMVAEAAELLRRSNSSAPLTPAVLEGVAAAKLLVASLKKCPDPITPQRLMATLESGAVFDIGWPDRAISYSKSNHSGTRFSETSIITRDGKFRR